MQPSDPTPATPLPAPDEPQYATIGELYNLIGNELDETRTREDAARLTAAMHALDERIPLAPHGEAAGEDEFFDDWYERVRRRASLPPLDILAPFVHGVLLEAYYCPPRRPTHPATAARVTPVAEAMMILRGARAIADLAGFTKIGWEHLEAEYRDDFLRQSEAILTAALSEATNG